MIRLVTGQRLDSVQWLYESARSAVSQEDADIIRRAADNHTNLHARQSLVESGQLVTRFFAITHDERSFDGI